MDQYKYILSIIIPTRNREFYAYASSMQALNSTNEDVQLVIQDNSDTNSLFELFKDSPFINRIKYSHSSGILSFVDNFSNGVIQAEGEYLCMIGDDDGINPEIVEFVKWAKRNNIEAITPEIRLNYIWPNTGIPYYKTDNGNLMIVEFSERFSYHNPQVEINKLLSTGGQNYLKYNLVKIYHGIVKKSAMDEVRLITGKYFGGLSPDIYSSVALSLVVKQVLKIDYPLTIPGVCRKSGSGHSSTGRHHGKLEDAPQLIGHSDYKWAEIVPRFYSVETLWADSAVAALQDMRRLDLVQKFNVHVLTSYCLLKYKEFSEAIKSDYLRYCKRNNVGKIQQKYQLLSGLIKGPFNDLLSRIANKVTRKKNSVEKYQDVKDIVEAQFILAEYLKLRSLSISKLINKLNK